MHNILNIVTNHVQGLLYIKPNSNINLYSNQRVTFRKRMALHEYLKNVVVLYYLLQFLFCFVLFSFRFRFSIRLFQDCGFILIEFWLMGNGFKSCSFVSHRHFLFPYSIYQYTVLYILVHMAIWLHAISSGTISLNKRLFDFR